MRFAKLMSITALAMLAVVASLASLTAHANRREENRAARYRIKDLGTLGGSFAQAGGVSNTGWVEGFSLVAGDTSFHEFLWHDGVMTDLGTLGGPTSFSEFRPNDRGDAGGESDTAVTDPNGEDFCAFGDFTTCFAFYYHNGVMTAQPNLGGLNGAGNGINDRGELAGTSENQIVEPSCDGTGTGQIFQFKPVIWKAGRVHELPTIPGDPVGTAFAINNNEQAVGQTGLCGIANLGTQSHAVLWQNGRAIDLGNLGGTLNNIAEDINELGAVVGFSGLTGDATFHAFLWKRGRMIDLGTLPGDVHSAGLAINIRGQVVGRSADANFNGSAYLWENGVMRDVNTLLPADSPLFVMNATGINDRGQIVGTAMISTGDMHAFLATPIDDDDAREGSAAFAAARESVQRPAIYLPERLRKMVETRGRRFHSR
jgi:probable HAF family extracellular repeat protein